jgi:hypothetical protein
VGGLGPGIHGICDDFEPAEVVFMLGEYFNDLEQAFFDYLLDRDVPDWFLLALGGKVGMADT